MLASSKGLQDTFPNIIVDAEVSRSMAKGQGLVDQLKAQGNLRPWVLVGLATNSVVTNDQLDDLLNDVGPDHVLVLINAHAPVSWVPGTNAVLKQFAAAHSNNVVLVDWTGPFPSMLTNLPEMASIRECPIRSTRRRSRIQSPLGSSKGTD